MESVHGTVAGLDVHKKTVVVVVLQSDHSDEDHAAGVFGTTRYGLNELIAFLRQHGVTHAAMESTAQYWRPVWMALEGQFTMTLAQARSTRAPRGRKWDKADAQRIAKRLLSGDLTVSYVPPPEQRDWRLLSRTQVAMHESVVRVRNQVEGLLEQAQIKLSSVVTDILGKSGRRMLDALVRGVSDPVELARLGDRRLHASKEQLADVLRAAQLTEAQRIVLKLYLEQIDLIERHMAEIDGESGTGSGTASGCNRALMRNPRHWCSHGTAHRGRNRTTSRSVRFSRQTGLMGRHVPRPAGRVEVLSGQQPFGKRELGCLDARYADRVGGDRHERQ